MFFSGERLKVARKHTFKTIDNLIQTLETEYDLKINKGMVSRWENGKTVPRDETIKTLAQCLSVPVDYLTGRESLGNNLIYQRLLNNMTVEELSQKAGIPVDSILQAESELSLITVEDLRKIGKAYGNDEFVTPLLKNAISNMLPLVKQEKEHPIFDLNILLESDLDVSYKNKLLTNDEKEKIKRVIEALLS